MKYNKKSILSLFILSFLFWSIEIIYANWYEEPPVYETENIDNMWWLSKNKKEKLKNEQREEIEKKKEENKSKEFSDKKIKWLYRDSDTTKFPREKWEVIDEDNDGIGYNYYFDENGFLLVDTITPDYRIVDKKGREVDYNFKLVEVNISNNMEDKGSIIVDKENSISPTKSPAKVIIGEGVILKNKNQKIYDNSINKNVIDYIDKNYRFIKDTKGIIYNEVRWKKCSSLKGNGGYVIFNNPNNNFNKITGNIATEYRTYEDNINCILKVYDADLYDKLNELHRLYDIEEIYQNSKFTNVKPTKFSFTFDRSIKRLRFEIETDENNKSLTVFLKDLKYGFKKSVFYEELIRKKEEEEEIEELKKLGIYVEDMWSFETLDEDGNEIEVDEEETEHENENNDDRIGGISYTSDEETRNYEDVVRDRNTGPAFDEELQNVKEIGPGFIDTN